jgi:hypothetical protein
MMNQRTALVSAVPALVLAVLVLVPFHDKAFTIDDTVFMMEARHALVDPLHPTAFEMTWGEAPGRLGLASGPIMAWLLIPSVLAGGAEWVAHAVQLALLALGILSTVALAMRLGLSPRWAAAAGLLLASTPATLAMAGTAMADVPAMALGVIGLERLIAWRQERRVAQGVLAAVALGLAPLARPHLALLLGVGAILGFDDLLAPLAWRERVQRWLPLAAAPVLSMAIMLLTRDPHPGALGPIAATASVSATSFVAPNLTAFPIHWVLVLPLALPWIALRPRSVIARWRFLLAATGAAALVVSVMLRWPFYFAMIAGVGATVIWDIGADAWRRRDLVQLALGAWLLIALVTAPYPHLPSKYLVASAPAAAILVARAMAAVTVARARAVLGAACALGLALGIAILRADAAFADLGRRAAAELIAPQVAAGERVWFVGRWGFQWYAEKAGGVAVTTTPPHPAAGDLVVVSQRTDSGGPGVRRLIDTYPRLERIGYLGDHTAGGRVMDSRLRAGFFSNQWGFLPWRWGRTVLDEFELFRVGAPVAAVSSRRGGGGG